MCSLDLELADVWTERVRTARKRHECDCCYRSIMPGEQYLAHSHVGNVTARSEKLCATCCFIRGDFEATHGGVVPSNVVGLICECIEGDRASPWRFHLAVILRRRRTAESCRRYLRREWIRNALGHSLALTRRILRKRATP